MSVACFISSFTGVQYEFSPWVLNILSFLLMINDYSQVTYLYFMKKISKLYSIFKSFLMEIKTKFNVSI